MPIQRFSPIDFTQGGVDINQKLLQGLQIGGAIRNIRASNAQTERQVEADKQAAITKAQYREDLESTFSDPTPQSFAKLVAKYPKQREAFKQSWDLLDEDKKQNELQETFKVYSALESGKPEIAKKIIDERIIAMENSGRDTTTLKNIQSQMEVNPDGVKNHTLMVLSSIMSPKDFAKNFETLTKVEQIPTEQQIKKDELKIKKDNTKLRVLEAGLRKESNELKREELKIKIDAQKTKLGESKIKIEQTKKERVAEAQTAITSFDNTLDTINSILDHPGLETATGMSSFLASIPGTDARDVSALVIKLESQAFLAEISKMKGMGALSEAEGKKISSAIANLDMGQSTKAFKNNLNTAKKIFKQGKERAVKKFGVKKIEETPAERTIIDTRTTPDGRVILLYSDGTYGAQ